MRFDSSKAWSEATGWTRANLNVLIPIAGIFVLLPTLSMSWFTTDLQLAMEAATAKPAAPDKIPTELIGLLGQFLGITVVLGFVQSIGTMAMLALFSDQARPTVGEALARSLRCLPTLIGTTLLLIVAGILAAVPVILAVGLLAGALALIGGPVLSGALGAGLMFFLIFLAAARFCVLSPAIVIDGTTNPVEALKRSWALTKGNTWPLAFFLFLLTVAYLVIVVAFQALLGLALGVGVSSEASQLASAGSTAQLVMGLVLGLVGAVAVVIFTGVTGAIHHQLSGSMPGRLSETFD